MLSLVVRGLWIARWVTLISSSVSRHDARPNVERASHCEPRDLVLVQVNSTSWTVVPELQFCPAAQ